MKYCSHCGAVALDSAMICLKCRNNTFVASPGAGTQAAAQTAARTVSPVKPVQQKNVYTQPPVQPTVQPPVQPVTPPVSPVQQAAPTPSHVQQPGTQQAANTFAQGAAAQAQQAAANISGAGKKAANAAKAAKAVRAAKSATAGKVCGPIEALGRKGAKYGLIIGIVIGIAVSIWVMLYGSSGERTSYTLFDAILMTIAYALSGTFYGFGLPFAGESIKRWALRGAQISGTISLITMIKMILQPGKKVDHFINGLLKIFFVMLFALMIGWMIGVFKGIKLIHQERKQMRQNGQTA